jgi:hypothetical protein
VTDTKTILVALPRDVVQLFVQGDCGASDYGAPGTIATVEKACRAALANPAPTDSARAVPDEVRKWAEKVRHDSDAGGTEPEDDQAVAEWILALPATPAPAPAAEVERLPEFPLDEFTDESITSLAVLCKFVNAYGDDKKRVDNHESRLLELERRLLSLEAKQPAPAARQEDKQP